MIRRRKKTQMVVIARVAEYEISEAELVLETEDLRCSPEQLKAERVHVLSRLIDSCLLCHEALNLGIKVEEDEFDSALLQSLESGDDNHGPIPLSASEAREMEQRITRRLMVRKYIRHLWNDAMEIDDARLKAFYEDQKDVFNAPESLRASHILIRRDTPNPEQKANQVRASIHDELQFNQACTQCSDCPTNLRCGDLGWFHRGQMIAAIEDMAFSMKVGEISPVFSSSHGFHILLLTGRKEAAPIPFEEIKESLRARLVALEREFYLTKLLNELREKYRSLIQILDADYNEAL